MATFAAVRPQFKDGDYLSADELEEIIAYLRSNDARQNLGQHSWGVAVGLDLVSSPISPTAVDYFVQPGVAIDGYGRLIVVQSPTRLDPAQFSGVGSGLVDVWIRYDQADFMATRPGFNNCNENDSYTRISEGFRLVFGSKGSVIQRESGVIVNEALVTDARDALRVVDPDAPLLLDGAVPHQEFPEDDTTALWLVPLGHVRWSAATNSFLPLVDPAEVEALQSGAGTKTPDQVYEALMQSRAKRRMLGVVAESVFAADGLIRLRERKVPADPANGNDAVSRAQAIQSRDMHVCEGQLKPKELVWLEGNVRIKGDARLLNGRLEFRDGEGRDYIARIVDGSTLTPSTPLLLQRSDNNPRGGSDLQMLLGRSDDGRNRFCIGSVGYEGKDLCNLTANVNPRVVVQDDGKLGIGTLNPDSPLSSPYTVRGLRQRVTENPGTPEEKTYDIYRLETYENAEGLPEWQLDLWDREDSTRKSLSFTDSVVGRSRLLLQDTGRIGMGTTEPTKQLHIHGNDPAIFLDINGNSGVDRCDLIFGKDGAAAAGLTWNKGSNRLLLHYGDINNIELTATYLMFRQNGTDTMTIRQGRVGIGTASPSTPLHVTGGTEATLASTSGYLLVGDVNSFNVVFGNNEIQARSAGAASALFLQAEGGDLVVNRGTSVVNFTNAGNVGVGTLTPTAKLDVRGDIRLGPTGALSAMAANENFRVVAGRVAANGTKIAGEGFTVTFIETGRYSLSFNPAFTSPPVVVACPAGSASAEEDNIVTVISVTNGSAVIRVMDVVVTGTGATAQNGSFNFIAVGTR